MNYPERFGEIMGNDFRYLQCSWLDDGDHRACSFIHAKSIRLVEVNKVPHAKVITCNDERPVVFVNLAYVTKWIPHQESL